MESSNEPSEPLTDIGFTNISQGVSHYKTNHRQLEGQNTFDNTPVGPNLIIICAWAFAQPRHIVKYLQPYQQIYPDSDILLIQNVIANPVWKPDAWQVSFFEPAAQIAHSYVINHEAPQFHVHAFSNGGSHAAVQLSEFYSQIFHTKLPVASLVLDSCPGQPRCQPTVDALVSGVPTQNPLVRGFAAGLSYLMVGATGLLDVLNLSQPASWKLYLRLNDLDDVFLVRNLDGKPKPISRSYMFSRSDTMILHEDVTGHAQVARQKLGRHFPIMNTVEEVIRLEEFSGTAHVNHVKTEAVRYWQTVCDTWFRANNDQQLASHKSELKILPTIEFVHSKSSLSHVYNPVILAGTSLEMNKQATAAV